MAWKHPGGSKYGLQLRNAPVAKKPLKPLSHFAFGDDADEDDDVEEQIARQASKKKALRDVEQQHKRALEEDPNVFDYDNVYDEMKEQKARDLQEDKMKREPKYIHKLVEKAKVRAQEHDIVYERQLAKERSKEDHLFGDKEKFVTGAYKKKLAEQAKWLEEERLRELREAADEVTKKSDMSDFYLNLLSKNVAFGAQKEAKKQTTVQKEESKVQSLKVDTAIPAHSKRQDVDPLLEATRESGNSVHQENLAPSHDKVPDIERVPAVTKSFRSENTNPGKADSPHDLQAMASVEEISSISRGRVESQIQPQVISTTSTEAKAMNIGKPQSDSLSAAKERYLARKKMREA